MDEATGTEEQARTYRVLPHPTFKPWMLAVARRYSDITNAVADMGTGVVVKDDGEIAAFHERHLPYLERVSR